MRSYTFRDYGINVRACNRYIQLKARLDSRTGALGLGLDLFSFKVQLITNTIFSCLAGLKDVYLVDISYQGGI